MPEANFRYADDESARLDIRSDDGDMTLVINPFGPKLSIPGEMDNEPVSTEHASEILNTVAAEVDPNALETAFDLLED